MEIFIFIENNKYIFLAAISILLAIFEYLYSIKTTKTFGSLYLQDLIFWFLILDNIILTNTEGKFSPFLSDFYEHGFITNLKSIFEIGALNPFIQFIIIFLIFELENYLFHRFIKHNSYGWNLHKVHHSTKQMNQFSDARNHPIFILIEGLVIILPIMMILSPSTEPMIIYGSIGTFWGPMIHMNCNIKWIYPLNYILSSPFTHRWHHSKENERCNYAGIFILYDVIFKTFYNPVAMCKETGFLDEENYPKNPLRSLFYPFIKK
jgi:sterol desaturase/sphingolipid hydroxylase (fatty acid hydroxylase superfamily)